MLSRVRGAKDSDMSKSTKTVVYFDWKTVIYIYVCGKCRTQFMLPMEKWVTFTGACANEIIPSINRSFVCKAKEERHVRICDKVCQWLAEGRWFSPVSSSNAIDRHDITEIFLQQCNWPPRYNWDIVESGVKHHKPNLLPCKSDVDDLTTDTSRESCLEYK
jgi:hypothetical protein